MQPHLSLTAKIIPFLGHNDIISYPPVAIQKLDMDGDIPTSPRPSIYATQRHLQPYGVAAYTFVHMGTYRGGSNTFATVGLASKPLHVFGNASFDCEWIPEGGQQQVKKAKGWKILPDWGYGRVYTVVVVNCTFADNAGSDSLGGELILHATQGEDQPPERIVALTEKAGEYNASSFDPPFKYNYLYCGSSLYGNISPQRLREWLAYHATTFGSSSHFIFYDAGVIAFDVQIVLEPWVKAGRVTIHDVREQARFDGYYYNQFLVVNDCLHRYRFAADWTFFFDVDEYIHTPPGISLHSAMEELENYTQFTIVQMPMSNKLCLATNPSRTNSYSKKWGFEKLVFRNVQKGVRWDRKYAIRARYAFATGVHMSENVVGETTHSKGSQITYYHFHDTISFRGEVCRAFVNRPKRKRTIWYENLPYKYDSEMVPLAGAAKEYELQEIGSQPAIL
ncbi:hypothetical protein O6H91_09G118400 [Diphasiastrum complanatum]|uniref:Uncharacterized protein n=1 Tax=Diphasiastrum complanatum TaxID=34168 RepID=A0ACC2CU48_DIPCM|nr:hypothetical protein O6H91_09G118400 [Diphasiastrum complanatum]